MEDEQMDSNAEDALREEFAKEEDITAKEKWHLLICFLVFLAGFAGDVTSIFLEYSTISRISRIAMSVSFLGVVYVVWKRSVRISNYDEKIFQDLLKRPKQPPP